MRHIAAAHNLAANDFLFALHSLRLALEFNGFALIIIEQQCLGDRVGPEVLFQDLQGVFARGIAQHHGIRLQVHRRAVVADVIDPRFEVQVNGIAHHREVLVVNSQSGFRGENRLRREAANKNRNKFFHIVLPICIRLTLFDTGRLTFLDGIPK